MKERTYIYVDGFNLYYGCLKNTPYKWLDLLALFKKLLHSNHQIVKIKYFSLKSDEIQFVGPRRLSANLRIRRLG